MKRFKDFLTEDLDGDIPVFAIYTLDIVLMMNAQLKSVNLDREEAGKDLLPKFTKADVTPEIKAAVVKAYEKEIGYWLYERNGITVDNVTAPSDAWDVIEQIVNDKSKES